MERFLDEVQNFVQRCLDGQTPSNVTIITSESYYEHTSDNGDKHITIKPSNGDRHITIKPSNGDRHITIKPRNVNKDLDNDKDLDYFYCQECGRKVYYSKNSMFMPHPQLCSFCESHNF
jgi:hypothetical protein